MTTLHPVLARLRTRRRLAGALLATSMVASSCGLAFGDEGDDISADVAIAGREGTVGSARFDEATAADLDATTTDKQQDSSPTTEATSLVEVDDRFDGRSTQYLGIDVELGALVRTAQTAQQYLRSEPATDTGRILLVEVSITNRSSGTVALPRTVLGIRLASGERLVPEEMLTRNGDSIDTARPEAQATERVVLSFRDADLAGASFEISEPSTIPQFIPLDVAVPVASPYELALPAQPAVSNLSSPSLWPACDYAWTGEVVSAAVVLEGLDGARFERALQGSRWIVVELLVTNDTTDSEDFYPCNSAAMPMTSISPRLRVDGVAMSETNRVSVSGTIGMDADAVVQFWYRVDVDADLVEFTDTGGTRIAAWQLDLPIVPGEA